MFIFLVPFYVLKYKKLRMFTDGVRTILLFCTTQHAEQQKRNQLFESRTMTSFYFLFTKDKCATKPCAVQNIKIFQCNIKHIHKLYLLYIYRLLLIYILHVHQVQHILHPHSHIKYTLIYIHSASVTLYFYYLDYSQALFSEHFSFRFLILVFVLV